MSESLGFNNTYALAVRVDTADRLGLRRISDLQRQSQLTAAFSSGFLERDDGWPGLARQYGLSLAAVRVMEHALTYRALASGEVDVMDVFSTDGQLERLRLRVLDDERGFFPDYSAVLRARKEMAERYPRTWASLREALEGKLDEKRMSRLNAMADLDGKSVAEVAAAFLGTESPGRTRKTGLVAELSALTLDHLVLVLVSLAAAIVLGVPMGIAAARFRKAGQIELGAGHAADDSRPRPARVHDPALRNRQGAGAGRPVALRAPCSRRSTYAGLIGIDGHLLRSRRPGLARGAPVRIELPSPPSGSWRASRRRRS
jgi:osmoprotectant transport system permease protein